MIKYILPAIIIFLIVLFWEKITDLVEKKFKNRKRPKNFSFKKFKKR